MTNIDKLLGLMADKHILEKKINASMKRAYPMGCEILYSWGRDMIRAKVQDHDYGVRLKVLNERTGKTRWIHVGMHSAPSRINVTLHRATRDKER